MRYMSRRDMFWAEGTFFPTYRLLFPAVLRRKHLEQWCIPVVPAWSVEFCLYGVAHMHSVTDGGFVSHRWAPVFYSSCAPGHTQKTAFPFISGISFLAMARGMIAMWQWVRQAPVLCSCYRRRKWCQQHVMSTESDCRPTHCRPKCRTKPGLTSGATKMWLLQWSCAVFSVWGVVSWSIWSDCKVFFPCRFSAEISYSEHLRVSPHFPIFTNYHSVSGASLPYWIWLGVSKCLVLRISGGIKKASMEHTQFAHLALCL